MSFNLKRPKRLGEENEDDLIRFQEEFLKNKSDQPAATVIKKHKTTENETNSAPESNMNNQHSKKVVIDCKSRIFMSQISFYNTLS